MIASDIRSVHVELSSRCNAWCPACPRNVNGYGLAPWLIEQDLSTDRYREILDSLPNLQMVQLCGNLGDPIIAGNILDAINYAIDRKLKIQIHTNGSLRSVAWWEHLGQLLKDHPHDIWFGIDGLSGTHEIHRQGTNYDKIIANASAFINAGGCATWQFIPFEHNEHQVKDCIKTSQQVGFKKFKFVKLYRNIKLSRHYRTGEQFNLLPPKEFQSIIHMPWKSKQVIQADCMHLSQPSVYLSANGSLSWCCYHAHITPFDSLDELFLSTLDLTHTHCVENCGSTK